MPDDTPLEEGPTHPTAGGDPIDEAVEQAFAYRGDVTVGLVDGSEVVGYLYNRESGVSEPFVQIFEPEGGPPRTIPYAQIARVRLTGRDTASGKSYAAWKRRKESAPSP